MSASLTSRILEHVNDANYQPVKPAVIAKQLGLAGEAVQELKKTIKRMVKAGEINWGPSHLVVAAKKTSHREPDGAVASATLSATPKIDDRADRRARRKNKSGSSGDSKHFTGTFRRAAGGFGFVRPEGTLRTEGRDADVFIPADKTGDAASGDIVSVRLSSKRGRMGKQEGTIIDVIERATNRFVGVYFEQAGMGMVQIDGKIFAHPIYVGDPGAKGVQADDKVVVEMVRFPSHTRDGEGVVVEVLGPRGEPGVDTMSIIYEFNLPGDFPEDVLENSRERAEQFDESVGRGRRDLTNLTIVTIDPIDARDFDDAISLERTGNGHWLLGVHIADVSHFVEPKTPLDREAHERATSVYLPDRVIPMLPEIISNNLASLQPHKVRYALSAMMEFTEEGIRVSTEVYKSAIKSCRRFTYEEVDEYLAAKKLTPAAKPAAVGKRKTKPPSVFRDLTPQVDALLTRMHALAMIFRARRFQRGALELTMPEMKIDLDKEGRVTGAHLAENTESHQIIEEFMLTANEAVAETLADAGLVFLRRVHGSPDPRKMRVLTEFVRELGYDAENLENRFELQSLLDTVKGDTRQHAINYATLRSMQKAVYSPEDDGHYALASDCYCHFTSPIRRYPDLTIHRLIDTLNRGKKPDQRMDQLVVLGDHCSEREQRAADAERELKKVKLLLYMSDKIGMELDGVITGVENFGLFITGIEIPAEGFVHISSLTDDYYRYDRAGHVIAGHRSGNSYRLGDTVRVSVAAVDIDTRELDFRLVARAGAPKKGRIKLPTKKTGGKPGGKHAKKSASKHKKKIRPGKIERKARKSPKGNQ
jgi:ribonuclease R